MHQSLMLLSQLKYTYYKHTIRKRILSSGKTTTRYEFVNQHVYVAIETDRVNQRCISIATYKCIYMYDSCREMHQSLLLSSQLK